MNNKLETISNLFEDKEIRSIWDSEKEEYYFSVVDVISALTNSKDPRKYWSVLKTRLKPPPVKGVHFFLSILFVLCL